MSKKKEPTVIEKEEPIVSDWVVSETKPGYRTRTVKFKNYTLIINRPILDPAEQKRREERAARELALALRDYELRKEGKL